MKNYSLIRKLGGCAILLSSIAVLVVSLLSAWQQYSFARSQALKQLHTLAEVTAYNLAAPGMFVDAVAATKVLESLSVDAEIVSARLVLNNQEILANYQLEGQHTNNLHQIRIAVQWQDETLGHLEIFYSLSQLQLFFQEQLLYVAMAALIVVVLVGVLFRVFIPKLLKPLRQLTELAEKISLEGRYELRADPGNSQDEVSQLTIRFNNMLDRIQQQDYRLRKQQEELEQRVQERTSQLETAMVEAQAANKTKSDFLAVMSHEIRTPLNGILGMTSLMLETELTAKQKRFARITRSSSEDLLAIINDILDFSKVEAGKLELDVHTCQLNLMVEDLVERFAPIAHSKQIELLCNTPLPPLSVRVDSGRLSQVLTNLLSNAIKFTEKGEVMLNMNVSFPSTDQVIVLFSVSDTGIGIAEEQHQRLFHAFSQADSTMARRFGGTGLGLAISQRIIQMMKGEIKCESEAGKGSRFYFELSLPLIEDARNHQWIAGFESLRVLVVDDNKTNLEILENWLCSWHIDPVMAESGQQALSILREKQFDVLLTDWIMPEMDGARLIQAIKEELEPQQSLLKIIVFSSADLTDSAKLESIPRLIKPVRQSELYNYLVATIKDLNYEEPAHKPTLAFANVQSELQVLLVEDNLVNQEVAIAMLHNLGITPAVAQNGKEGLDMLKSKAFDLVLMDCQMPLMDGFEATTQWRAYEKEQQLPELPIIALTANAIVGDKELCLAAGMSDYLSKPFKFEQLTEIILHWSPDQYIKINNLEAVSSASIIQKSPAENIKELLDIDEKLLEQLRQLRPGLLGSVVQLFRQSTPDLLVTLEQGSLDQQAELVFKAAHMLKNSAANLGLRTMADICKQLEASARQGDLSKANEYLEQIQTLYRASLNYWDEWGLA